MFKMTLESRFKPVMGLCGFFVLWVYVFDLSAQIRVNCSFRINCIIACLSRVLTRLEKNSNSFKMY